jgi:hypothetical protein
MQIVAHIARPLADLAQLGNWRPVESRDEFSAFHAVHLQSDGVPIMLLEYDPVPGYVYVWVDSDNPSPKWLLLPLLRQLDISESDLPWTVWQEP